MLRRLIIRCRLLSPVLIKKRKKAADLSRENINRKTFEKIESAMVVDKVYLDTSLSLFSLASIVGSNRTYVCDAFKFMNTTYKKYVNRYRVKYVISLIEDGVFHYSGETMANLSGFPSRRVMDSALLVSTGKTYYELIKNKRKYYSGIKK